MSELIRPGRTLPEREADLLAWSAAFSRRLVLEPGRYGVSAAEAAAVSAAAGVFAAAYASASDPESRTRGLVRAKREARDQLYRALRRAVRLIRAAGTGAREQIELGLHVPRSTTVAGAPRPRRREPGVGGAAVIEVGGGAEGAGGIGGGSEGDWRDGGDGGDGGGPVVVVVGMEPGRHEVRVWDGVNPTGRALPRGVAGVQLFYRVLEERAVVGEREVVGERAVVGEREVLGAVMDGSGWRWAGMATRGRVVLVYGSEVRGRRVAVMGRWFDRRGRLGRAGPATVATVAA